jgi:hypothetical protein
MMKRGGRRRMKYDGQEKKAAVVMANGKVKGHGRIETRLCKVV